MRYVRPTISLIFAVLVLVSSSNFMVGIHLCSGRVQDVAFLRAADKCAMEKTMPPCHKKEPKTCCEDERIVHEGEDFKTSTASITLESITPIDIQIPLVLISELIPTTPSLRAEWYNYDPPLRAEDRVVTNRIFLI